LGGKRPVLLPNKLGMYFDLLQLNLPPSVLDDLSYLDILLVWLDRQNKKGFQYESKDIKGQREAKTDFLYFYK
jgi:hypothetical protein